MPRRRRAPWIPALTLLGLVGLVGGGVVSFLLSVAPPRTDTYVEAIAAEPPLINPILAPFTLADEDVLPLVFSGLVQSDPSGNVAPDLAEAWDVSPDGRVYTFRLRDGIAWHDGQPVDAHDVVFTISLIQAPDHQGSQELAELWRDVNVEAEDARTVRFSLPDPLASFPEHVTVGLLPRHLLEGVPAGALPNHSFNQQPVGSGPYVVVELDSGRLVLERNPDYYGPSPGLRRIELWFFAERSLALEALLSSRVDGLGHLRADEAEVAASSPRLAVYSVPERSKLATLSLNVQSPLFGERAVRLAVARAIDRGALIGQALGGHAEPAFGPIPVNSWAYADLYAMGEYDPSSAAALLDEAGWRWGPNGVRERDGQSLSFSILTANSPERLAVTQELATQLGAVGFAVRVEAVPGRDLIEDYIEPRRFEAALVGQWVMGSDPDVYPQWHSSQATGSGDNYAGFSDPDVDRWLEAGRQQLTLEERRNAYLHFQARWVEEQPSVTLYHPLYSFAISKDIQGVAAGPLPDSSWRLRDALHWYRAAQPTILQQARSYLPL